MFNGFTIYGQDSHLGRMTQLISSAPINFIYLYQIRKVNRLGGLSLPRKSVVRLTDRPDMTVDVYRGRKTTIQQQQPNS